MTRPIRPKSDRKPNRSEAGNAEGPWSRRVAALSITRKGQDMELSADAATRDRVKEALDLESLDLLSAHFTLRLAGGNIITVVGEVEASGQQRCVISLAPVPFVLKEQIEQRFAGEEALPPPTKAEIERSLEDPDPPEPFDNGMIDLGALAVETLSLALPSFPKVEGALHQDSRETEDSPVRQESPFAALSALKIKT
jgi:uncharacterized metal-binding protein YceD (DUF177 family)